MKTDFFKSNLFKRQWFDYLFVMTKKEIKSKYKNTILGFFWIFVNPLLQMLVIGFVFRFFIPVEIDNYFLFLFAGLLPWNFFSYSLTQATPSIVNERDLIKKSSLNREIIVISIVLSNMFHFLASLALLLLFLFFTQLFTAFTFTALFSFLINSLKLLPYLVWIFLLSTSLSLIFSALNVKFRDLNFVVKAIVPLWFYVTPIVYSLNSLPSNLKIILSLNPVTPIIEGFRSVLLSTPAIPKELLLIHILIMLLLFVISIFFFNKKSRDFADWV